MRRLAGWLLLVAAILSPYLQVRGDQVEPQDSDESGNAGGGSMDWIKDLFGDFMNDDDDDTTTTETPDDTQETTTSATTTSASSSSTTTTSGTTTTTLGKETPVTTTTTTQPEVMEGAGCVIPNDLGAYDCDLSQDFLTYMGSNTSSEAVVGKLFSSDVIDLLLSTCDRGEWCLPDSYISAFGNGMNSFLAGPLCDNDVMFCMDDVVFFRAGCPDMERLSMMDSSLGLLCRMRDLPGLTPACFGHTVATLHISMADKLRSQEPPPNLNGVDGGFCGGSYVGMTRKMMCTMKSCPHHNQLFDEFEPWQWFLDDVPTIQYMCHIEKVCGDEVQYTPYYSSTTEYSPEYTTTSEYTPRYIEDDGSGYEDMTDQEDEKPALVDMAGSQEGSEQNQPFNIIRISDASTRLVIGVTTGAIVGVLAVMLLVCVLFKRTRRRRKYGADKSGYAKLPSEDTE